MIAERLLYFQNIESLYKKKKKKRYLLLYHRGGKIPTVTIS